MIFKTKSEIDTCSLMVPSLPLHIVLVSKEISNDPPKNSILVALVEKVLTPGGLSIVQLVSHNLIPGSQEI